MRSSKYTESYILYDKASLELIEVQNLDRYMHDGRIRMAPKSIGLVVLVRQNLPRQP